MSGGNGNDSLYGEAGQDVLIGNGGDDWMAGGLGDDRYLVSQLGDVVFEAAGEGLDTVLTSLNTYALGTHLERLVFTGTGSFSGTGNALDNFFAGGSGADTFAGGLGNDRYTVEAGDVVTEAVNGGVDTVLTGLDTYTLGNNLERLLYNGTGNFNGTGNALNNFLAGKAGDDTLDGGLGNDRLDGGEGADFLTGGLGRDIFVFRHGEASGDTVLDFTGNGAASGDLLQFHGYGTAADGAVLSWLGGNSWVIERADGTGRGDVITVVGAVVFQDYIFV